LVEIGVLVVVAVVVEEEGEEEEGEEERRVCVPRSAYEACRAMKAAPVVVEERLTVAGRQPLVEAEVWLGLAWLQNGASEVVSSCVKAWE
jgi:hypothetical protein